MPKLRVPVSEDVVMIGAALIALAAAPSFGSIISYKDGWRLSRDDSGTCTISRQLDSGVYTAFIRTRTDPLSIKMLLLNSFWGSLQRGENYPVTLTIAGGQGSGTGLAIQRANLPGLVVGVAKVTLAPAFLGADHIIVQTEGKILADIPMNAPEAYLGLIRCATGSRDPFAK